MPSSSQLDGQHGQHRHLGGKGLGTGDADFRPDAQIDAGIGHPCDGGTDHVDDAQDGRAAFFGLFDDGQGVGGLAGLTNGDNNGAFFGWLR